MTRIARRRLCLGALPVFASLFLPGLVRNGLSQVAWMTPSYSSYTSATTDGTYIYTSATVSGTTTGTCPTFPAYLANECSITTHAPQVYNVIGSVGGWQYGGAVYWNSSISMTNNQKIAATHGTEYTFSSTAQVICSFIGGPIYSFSITDYVAIKATYGKNTLGYDDVGTTRFCGETPACSNNVTPACGYPNWTDAESTSHPCYPYIAAEFLAVRGSNTSPWYCTPGVSSSATGPGPCDQ
jgi:hypothetical protein